MALVMKKFYELLSWSLTELPDPRSENLFLAGSVLSPITVILLYLYFVLSIGPKLMKKRKAYDLDKLLVFYNAAQVIACLYIAIEGCRQALFSYDWRCAAVDYSNSDDALKMVFLAYLYYLIKIIDLLDTIFFVLRKKSRQVTFLHIYHHFGMVAVGWVGVRFIPGGHSVYLGIINCFVHAVMYFYYLLTAYDKEYKKSIWWKKHITQLQLGQFITFFFLYGQLIFREDCKFPIVTQAFFLPQVSVMTILFADFYYKTYIKKPHTENKGGRLTLFKYDWRCAPVDYSYNKDALKVMFLTYLYYLIKIIDLLDTVFFLLRKKEKQVTFLHIYHHAGMVAIAWVGIRYIAGGHSVYLGIINSVVHAVMYFYYLLTAYDKEYKKSIWWKKHITQLQLAQFISFFFIYGQLVVRKNCNFPVITQVVFLPQVTIMTILFADFYYKAYIKKPQTPQKPIVAVSGTSEVKSQ